MKTEIIDNAIELFAQKGYFGCTLDELAKSVDIKKASLYYYFPSKASIYRECSKRVFDHFNRILKLQLEITDLTLENFKQFVLDTTFKTNLNYVRMYLQFNQAPVEFKEELYEGIAGIHDLLDKIFKKYYEFNDFTIQFKDFRELMLGILESCFVRVAFINYFDELSHRRKTFENDVNSMMNSLLEIDQAKVN